jgi:hypothetical protein
MGLRNRLGISTVMSELQLYFDDSSFDIQYSPSTAWADNSSEIWTSGRSKVVTQFPGAQMTFNFNGKRSYFNTPGLRSSNYLKFL